jgi:small subunit ribosomal protein S16
MAVKIRLTRAGSKKKPFYRIVAADSASRRDGRPLEYLGWYNPMTDPAGVSIDMEKVRKWLGIGAETTDTVRNLLKQQQPAAVGTQSSHA